MNNIGLNKERLQKECVLDTLLRGCKTNTLIPIIINIGSAVTHMDARLSLQPGENGNVVVAIHGVRQKPNLNIAFFGHEFTKKDKENLLKIGNMGRVVELINLKSGEKTPSIISIYRLTNEVIALRQEWMKIPDEIKGVKLNDEQNIIIIEYPTADDTKAMSVFFCFTISQRGLPCVLGVSMNCAICFGSLKLKMTKSTATLNSEIAKYE